MKDLIFIIPFFFILLSCVKQGKKVIELGDGSKEVKYYPNKKDTTTYVREFYYKNGELGTVGKIDNSKMDSTWTWYYSNGRIKDLAYLENGLFITEKRHWYPNGSIKSIEYIDVPCDHDCCDGYILYYDSLNTLSQKVKVRDRMWQDTFYQYREDGSIFILSWYKDDKQNGFYHEYYPNSAKWVIGQFSDDKRNGLWEWYDTSGRLTKKQYYKNGEVVDASEL